MNTLCDTIGANAFLQYITIPEWKQYAGSKSTQPLNDAIASAISAAKTSRGKGATARYNAGVKLMNDTKPLLHQLRQFVSAGDLQYQMIADKLGLEILQCGIDYYNGSEDRDAARKAMVLQKYAQSIVVGKMAKDRCKENVDILSNIIAKLPPAEVFDEDHAIKEEMRKYCQLPDKICHAITLLTNTRPYLLSIKSKLGVNNGYYLKLSTQVVGNALHNLIEEVNAAQEDDDDESSRITYIQDSEIRRLLKIQSIKLVLESAWKATRILDTFDMEADFKNNRYLPNRKTLENLCIQFHIDVANNSSRTGGTVVSPPKKTTKVYNSSIQNQNTVGNKTSPSSAKGPNSVEWGFIIGIFVIIVVLLCVNLCQDDHGSYRPEEVYEYVDSDTVAVDTVPTFESEREGYIVDEASNGEDYNSSESVSALEEAVNFERQSTGSRPYAYYYGSPQEGESKMTFKTSSGSDYVVIVRDEATDEVVNHVYIQGGDRWTISVPNGAYNVYFYSGTGWLPTKDNGNVTGGFYYNEQIQKDYVSLSYQDVTYTLYTVQNGNLQLQHASAGEAF